MICYYYLIINAVATIATATVYTLLRLIQWTIIQAVVAVATAVTASAGSGNFQQTSINK